MSRWLRIPAMLPHDFSGITALLPDGNLARSIGAVTTSTPLSRIKQFFPTCHQVN